MDKAGFLHVGLTVRSLDRTIEFYTKYFGFELEMRGTFSEDFIREHNSLYQVEEGTYSDFCFLKSADGIVLEVFEFHPIENENQTVWNRPGYTHICLKVADIFEAYEGMKANGVHFFFEPGQRATPEEHWVFLQDPDGNLIELQD